MEFVQLQGIGKKPGKPARELRPGDVIIWNYGYKSTVILATPSKTGKTIDALLLSHDTGATRARKLGAGRLVAVA